MERGHDDIVLYLTNARNPSASVDMKRVKVIIVGPGDAGKTTLVRRLLSDTFGSPPGMTDGIAIEHWEYEGIQFHFWDFGGQAVYMNTHPLFFDSHTIFVLVWNPRANNHLDLYLESVRNCAAAAPLLLVTTHGDEVSSVSELDVGRYTHEYGPVAEYVHIDSSSGTGIDQLRSSLVAAALSQEHVVQQVPRSLVELEKHLARASREHFHMPADEFHALARGQFEMSAELSEWVLGLFHRWGVVYVLPGGEVVLAPQQLADVMACVITAHTSTLDRLGGLGREGLLVHNHISEVWSAYPEPLHASFLELMHQCGLAYPLHDAAGGDLHASIVPAMLPEYPLGLSMGVGGVGCGEDELTQAFLGGLTPLPTVRVEVNHLPRQLIAKLQVRLRSLATLGGAWRSGCVLRLDRSGSDGDETSLQPSLCVVQRLSNPDRLSLMAAGSSSAAQTEVIDALLKLRDGEFPRVQFTDVELQISDRPYHKHDILEALEEDGIDAHISHKRSGVRVSVFGLAGLVGYRLETLHVEPPPSQPNHVALPPIPEWLQSLDVELRAAESNGFGDEWLVRVNNELRRCIPACITACGLSHFRNGVRCLFVTSKSSRHVFGISPGATKLDRWRVVEQGSMELPPEYDRRPVTVGDNGELLLSVASVVLRALDVLGVVDAASLYTLEPLSSLQSALRTCQWEHFEAVADDDVLMYAKDVAASMRALAMAAASTDTQNALLSQIRAEVRDIHTHTFS